MKSDYALQLMADMLWNTALVAAPILLMALVVGLRVRTAHADSLL